MKQDKIKEIQERKIKKEQEPPENTDEGNVGTSCHVILASKETALCRFQTLQAPANINMLMILSTGIFRYCYVLMS